MLHTPEHTKRLVFTDIYIKNYRKVKYFAYAYMKDIQAAESIAHDVFLTLWKKWEQIDINDNIVSYLMVSAKNASLNYIRREKKMLDFKGYSQKFTKETINHAALADESSTILYSKEITEILHQALAQMPPKTKSTFILSRFKGMKYHEIAKLESVSIKTVEFRISSALKLLRKYLKNYFEI